MKSTGPDTRNRARVILGRHGAISIGDMAKRLGCAYNTARAAMTDIGASPVPNTYPAKWRFGGSNAIAVESVDAPRLQAETKDIDIILSISTLSEWVDRWESARTQFGATVSLMALAADADVKQLTEDLARGAQTLAGLAYALQQVQDRPDWYEILGGDTEAKA